jgi:hypothetical protein
VRNEKFFLCQINILLKQANTIAEQVDEIFSSITAALKIHLNIEQDSKINTSSVFVSMVAVPRDSILEKFIEPIGGAQIRIPSNLNLTLNDSEKMFVRVSCLRYSAV